jgi:hypothetical protein
VFCSVPCWASHVPTFRHREAWALENTAPSLQAYLAELKAEESATDKSSETVVPASTGERKKVPMANSSIPSATNDSEVLVVVSKMKAYIKAKGDMNTSGEVMELLSDRLRRICDEAIRHARQDGRKTVMARDFVGDSES